MPTDRQGPQPRGVRVFISYAHVDERLRERLRAHLAALEREGLVHAWDDREILGGEQWADEIDDGLNQADVILLLVSADFIKSDYCYGKELKRALERHADPEDRAIVIPVILAQCDWKSSDFAHLQALPHGASPSAEWKTEDHFFTAVVKGLRQRIRKLIAPGGSWRDRVFVRLRDPLWWQRPVVWAVTGVVLLSTLGAVWWWWRAASQTDAEVAVALKAMRSGRYWDAAQTLEAGCRRLVSRGACFALEKARLGVRLETPDALPLERFGAQVEALKARTPDDPDLLLIAAELALREDRAEGHAQALNDIARAIELAGGRYPEAHFFLANLQMLAGRFSDALPLLDQALEANTVAPDHYLNARAYARARTGDVEGAVRDYEKSAELGSILSRIEVAPLLWGRSEFERASDQLLAADRALASSDGPLAGRNALPWVFEIGARDPVVLKQAQDKRCLAGWMAQAGRALADRGALDAAVPDEPCGAKATEIRAAVTAMLARAIQGGMEAAGRQRAAGFARLHGLRLPQEGGG